MASSAIDSNVPFIVRHYHSFTGVPNVTPIGARDFEQMWYERPVEVARNCMTECYAAGVEDSRSANIIDQDIQEIGDLLQDFDGSDIQALLDDCNGMDGGYQNQFVVSSGVACGQAADYVCGQQSYYGDQTAAAVVKTEKTDAETTTPRLVADENGNYFDYQSPLSWCTYDVPWGGRSLTAAEHGYCSWTFHEFNERRQILPQAGSSSFVTSSAPSPVANDIPDVRYSESYAAAHVSFSGCNSGAYLSSTDTSLSSRPSSTVSGEQERCDLSSVSFDSPPATRAPAESRRPRGSRQHVVNRRRRAVCLWQFLRELLYSPETCAVSENGISKPPIRWLDRDRGIFKIEDSTLVAKLWGERKNRPLMNYDKLSRSIRQYYKHGIIKKTSKSRRLVFQFCPQYI